MTTSLDAAWAAAATGAAGVAGAACVVGPLPAKRPARARAIALVPGARPRRERLSAGRRVSCSSTTPELRSLASTIQGGCLLQPPVNTFCVGACRLGFFRLPLMDSLGATEATAVRAAAKADTAAVQAAAVAWIPLAAKVAALVALDAAAAVAALLDQRLRLG